MPYHGYYYGIDMYYIVLVLPCVLFAFWAQVARKILSGDLDADSTITVDVENGDAPRPHAIRF